MAHVPVTVTFSGNLITLTYNTSGQAFRTDQIEVEPGVREGVQVRMPEYDRGPEEPVGVSVLSTLDMTYIPPEVRAILNVDPFASQITPMPAGTGGLLPGLAGLPAASAPAPLGRAINSFTTQNISSEWGLLGLPLSELRIVDRATSSDLRELGVLGTTFSSELESLTEDVSRGPRGGSPWINNE